MLTVKLQPHAPPPLGLLAAFEYPVYCPDFAEAFARSRFFICAGEAGDGSIRKNFAFCLDSRIIQVEYKQNNESEPRLGRSKEPCYRHGINCCAKLAPRYRQT